VLGDKNPEVPAELFDFIAAKATTVAEALHSMSDRQKERMASDIRKNRGRVADSDLAAAVMQDVALFGTRAVKWSDG